MFTLPPRLLHNTFPHNFSTSPPILAHLNSPFIERSLIMPLWDPLVPAERFIQRGLARLPAPVSHWLGYRAKAPSSSPTWIICVYGFFGAFCGLSVILAIFGHTDYFTSRAVPPIVASFVRLPNRSHWPAATDNGPSGRFCNSLLRSD